MPHSAPATRTANPDVSVAKSFNVPGKGTTRRRLPPLRLVHRTYAPNDLLKKSRSHGTDLGQGPQSGV